MAMTTADAGWRRGAGMLVRGIEGISTLCGWIAASMILASVLITCQMIFVRFMLRQSTIWQTETVIYMMIAATMLGLPYVQKLRGHVNVDLLPMALSPTPRMVLAVLVLASGIVVLSIMGFYAFEHWQIAYQRGWRSSSVWGPRLWVAYIAMPVGFALFILQLLADLLALLIGRDKAFGLEAN